MAWIISRSFFEKDIHLCREFYAADSLMQQRASSLSLVLWKKNKQPQATLSLSLIHLEGCEEAVPFVAKKKKHFSPPKASFYT